MDWQPIESAELTDDEAAILRDPVIVLSPFSNALSPLGRSITRLQRLGYLQSEWSGRRDDLIRYHPTLASAAALERYRVAKLAEIGVYEIAA